MIKLITTSETPSDVDITIIPVDIHCPLESGNCDECKQSDKGKCDTHTSEIHGFNNTDGEVMVKWVGEFEVKIYCGYDNTLIGSLKDSVRSAVISGRKLKKLRSISIMACDDNVGDITLGAALGEYTFEGYKSDKGIPHQVYVNIPDVENIEDVMSEFVKGYTIGKGINYSKTLTNTPAIELTPANFCDSIIGEVIIDDGNFEWDIKNISKFPLVGAVGAGSKNKPKVLKVSYRGGTRNDSLFSLIGKGVTYDSGGYSLKPSSSMKNMKIDMGGAATVAGILSIVKDLKPKVNIDFWFPLAENMIGPDAIRPGDVVQAANGKFVEVTNTDAEGRLLLADCIYHSSNDKPQYIIDIATLTGAVVRALGTDITGAFTNNDSFYKSIVESSERCGESIWRLPVTETNHDSLKSDIADFTNAGCKPEGSASNAAAFLEKFVGDEYYLGESTGNSIPWIHLDIAGTATDSKNLATGVMIETLVDMLGIARRTDRNAGRYASIAK